jgi:predicted polyphosphate/ATP-dependent NAD kinase
VRALKLPTPEGQVWPKVSFIDIEPEDSPADTLEAVRRMVAEGVGAIMVLGGDGTNRLAASAAGETPLVSLSTGTNNVFPAMREATIAGLAAGLIATGRVPVDDACYRNKVLRLRSTVRRATSRWSTCASAISCSPARRRCGGPRA